MDSEGDLMSSLWSPQEVDVVQAKASRAGQVRRLADVQERILRLQEEKISLERDIHHYDGILAPIPRIPNDILREIFALTVPRVVSFTSSRAPLLLTHVCRRWRQVAIDFIALWRSLSIHCWPLKGGGLRVASELMSWSVVGGSILPSVAPMLTRLSLNGVPLDLLTSPKPNVFPCLERLVITIDEDLPSENLSIQAFMDAPRLRYVSLHDWEDLVASGKAQISLPWKQLTHFLYEGDSVTSFLPLCPNLVYLRIELNETQPDPDPWSQLPKGQCLPLLEGLSIYFPQAFYHPIEFFDTYQVPNLTSLRLEMEGLVYDYEVCNYLRTVMSHGTQLTRLSLRCNDLTARTLRPLLEATPDVRILDIQLLLYDDDGHDTDWEGFIELLEWNDQDQQHHLLPQLHTLVLRPAVEMSDEDHEQLFAPITLNPHFLTFISSRMARPMDQRIRKIVTNPLRPLDRELIQHYINDGLIYEEYPVRDSGLADKSEAWMDDDPALYDWPELKRC